MKSIKCISILVILVMTIVMTGCNKNKSTASATKSTSVGSKSQESLKTTVKKTTSTGTTKKTSTEDASGNLTDNDNEELPDESPDETPDAGDEPEEKEVFNLEGAKIITMFWAPKWEDRVASSSPNGFEASIDKRIKAAEEKYNFVWEPQLVTPNAAHSTNFINASLAGIKYCDILSTQSYFSFPTFTNNKLIIPIDDYVDFENDPFYSTNAYGKGTNYWHGHYWGISELSGNIGMNMLYNKDLFNREGQTDLQQLVDSKQWTWPELLRIGLETTKDLNGDGIVDQWGLVVQTQGNMAQGLLWSNGGRYLIEQEDGRISVGFTEPKAMRALQFYTDLYNVHKIVNSNPNLFPQGTALMIVGYAGLGATARAGGINYGFAPMPMGPDVNEYQHVTVSGNQFVFSTMLENPEKVVKIFADIYNPLSDSSYPISMDDAFVSWLQRWYQPYDIDRTLAHGKTLAFDMFQGFPEFVSKATNELYAPIANGNTSVGMLVDQLRPALQSILDKNIIN